MPRMLDQIDIQIIREIQRFDRTEPATQAGVGDRVGLTKTPVRERIKRLRGDRIIRSWAAMLDPDVIGVTFTAYVLVTLRQHSKKDLADFRAIVRQGYFINSDDRRVDITRIMECYSITGQADFLLRVVATDKINFAIFIEEELLDIPIVEHVNSMIVLREVKYTTEYPEKFINRLANEKLGTSSHDNVPEERTGTSPNRRSRQVRSRSRGTRKDGI